MERFFTKRISHFWVCQLGHSSFRDRSTLCYISHHYCVAISLTIFICGVSLFMSLLEIIPGDPKLEDCHTLNGHGSGPHSEGFKRPHSSRLSFNKHSEQFQKQSCLAGCTMEGMNLKILAITWSTFAVLIHYTLSDTKRYSDKSHGRNLKPMVHYFSGCVAHFKQHPPL